MRLPAFGPVTVLVNNAGIYPPDGTLATREDTFDRVFAVNVKAPFFLTAAVVPAMIEAGGGVIINLGSWIARLGIPAGLSTVQRRAPSKPSPAPGPPSSARKASESMPSRQEWYSTT